MHKAGYSLLILEGINYFQHTIVETTYSIFYSFDILNDGSFIVAGFSSAANSNPYIIKMDSSRGTEWHHTYDESLSNACLQSIVSGPNSNYIACGYLASSQVFYVLMIDIYGSELWHKEYGVAGKVNKCFEVANLQNGNYGAVGSTSSVGKGELDGWVMKFSFEGNLLFQSTFGGTSSDYIIGFVIENDGGFTAGGYTYSFPTSSVYLNAYIKGGYFLCEPGFYFIYPVCTPCPVGTYVDKNGATECADCAEGFYQDTLGETSCKTCTTNYYPNILKTLCLYKGIFSNEASFTSSSFKVNCFDSGGNIITPFTEACRNSYRALCCLGSSTLSAGPICNFGLEISSTSSLYNKYCSACTFMDQTQCPEQGLCWDDFSYINNNYDPYLSFSPLCIEAIKSYCGEKLQLNPNNGECYMFKSLCASPTISSASYGISYSSFTIVTDQKLSTEAIGADIFNSGMSKAKITKRSETELLIDISEMAFPPSSFQFKYRGLTNFCEVGFPETTVYLIAKPTTEFETVSISDTTTGVSKCSNFILSSTVTKPYSWPVEYTWNFHYTTTSTPTNLLNLISGMKTSTLSLGPNYLLEGETFEVSLSITNPFSQTVTSNVLSHTVQSLPNNNYPCSPCQLHNRIRCIEL